MKHKLTRLTALMLAFVMSFSMLLVPVNAADFTDVSENAWYAAAVDYAYEKGWMNGVSDTEFAPMKDVTRAMFVTVLARFADAELDDTVSAFTDTKAGKWYTGAAAWAAQNGVTVGVGENRFAPNKTITRQDFCTMLYRYIQKEGIEIPHDADVGYADRGSVAAYARDAVDFCYAAGLVSGFDDGTFRPKNTANRAQLAQILMRLDLLIKGEEAPTDPMPAQSFDGEAGEDMSISVNAPEGALPENTGMALSPVTDEASLEILAAKAKAQVFAAADISFVKDGEEIEPNAAVEVQISLEGLENIENPAVVHVNSKGNVEFVSSEMVSTNRAGTQKALRFMAKDFSVYAVIGDGQTGENARLTVEFYDSDREGAEPAKSYVVTKHDIVELEDHSKTIESAVPDPALSQSQGTMTFCGWTTNCAYTSSDLLNTDGTYKDCSLDVIRQQIITLLESGTVKEGDTYPVYAMYFNNFTVTYLNETGGTIVATDSIYTKQNNLNYKVFASYSAEDNDAAFRGWTMVGDPSQTVIQNYDEIEVSEDLSLKAYVRKGKWITFSEKTGGSDEYKGATYTPPKFIVDGALKTEDEPADPVLNGYIFEGWFVKKTDGTPSTEEFTFSDRQISMNYDLEAHWTRKTQANYTVLFWKQNLAGTGYDFDKSQVVKNAAVDGSTSVTKLGSGNNTYVTVDGVETKYEGFRVKTGTIESATVKPDDTTVINVYFDRNEYTLTFQDFTSPYSQISSSSLNINDAYVYGYVQGATVSTSNGYASFSTGYRKLYYRNSAWYFLTDADSNGNQWWCKYSSYSYYSTARYYHGTATTVKTITALYGTPIGNNFPIVGTNGVTYNEGQRWEPQDSSVWSLVLVYIDTMPAENIKFYVNVADRPIKTMYYYVEALPTDTSTVTIGGKEYVAYTSQPIRALYNGVSEEDFQELTGFTKERVTNTSGETLNLFIPDVIASQGDDDKYYEWDESNAATVYFLYTRDKYRIVYQDGMYYSHNKDNDNPGSYQVLGRDKVEYRTYISQSGEILYNSDISSYRSGGSNYYTPTLTGFDFQGWYLDSACQTALTSSNFSNMPLGGVVLYAKWQQRAIRVVLNVNGGTLPSGQAPNFKIAEYEVISSGQEIKPTRTGYEFVGWYQDPNFTKPYNFNTALFYKENDSSSTADTYSAEDRATFDDSARPFVVGIRKLYAKWRRDLPGANGLTVVYKSNDTDNPSTGSGTFLTDYDTGDNTTSTDRKPYQDGTEAIGRAASEPETGKRFLYWEYEKVVNGETVKVQVYPGKPFRLDAADAVHVGPNSSVVQPQTSVMPASTLVRSASGGTRPLTAEEPTTLASWDISFSSLPSTWKNYDADGDGFSWKIGNSNKVYVNSGSYCLYSESYDKSTTTALTPDNWLVTPAVENLPSGTNVVSLYARGQDAKYPSEHFEIWVTTDNSSANAIQNNGVKIAEATTTSTYTETTGRIPPRFEGEDVYVAIRHHGSTNQFYLNVDDITVTNTPPAAVVGGDDEVYWEPTDTIIPGEEYLIGIVSTNNTAYLIMNYNPDESRYYYADSSDNWHAYAIAAIRDNDGNVIGVSNDSISNATIEHATWKFIATSTNNKYLIQSGNNGNKYLRTYASTSTSNLDLYPGDSDDTYGGWYYTNRQLRLNINGTTKYMSRYWISSTGVITRFATHFDSQYAQTIQLYHKKVIHNVTKYTVEFYGWNGVLLSDYTQEVEEFGAAEAPPVSALGMPATGYNFTGWDPDDFDYVTGDMKVYAQFETAAGTNVYTVVFVDKDSNVISRQTVEEGNPATPPDTNPAPPSSNYRFVGWDVDFSEVRSDLIVSPVFEKIVTDSYTITLHAVYADVEPEKKTHVTWYANNGTDDNDDVDDIKLNQGFDIDTPELFKTHTGKDLENDGYTFLGWARLPERPEHVHDFAPKFEGEGKYETYMDAENGQNVTKIKEYHGLTEDDLWLVYHPADAEANTPAHFTIKNETGMTDGTTVTQIAPNEKMPYHGLYAVWKRDVFYVLHSSTGELEAVAMPVKSDGTSVEGVSYMVGTANLVERVKPGYLYGGYYMAEGTGVTYAYALVDHADVQAVADAYTANSAAANWTAVAAISSDASAASTVATTTMSAQGKTFKKYFGDFLYVDGNGNGTNEQYTKTGEGDNVTYTKNRNVWYRKAAQKTVKGDAITPKPGSIYYLKEVPSEYLPSKMFYTYDTTSENKDIKDIWLISLLDDGNYSAAGFTVKQGDSAEEFVAKKSLSLSFSMIQQAGATNDEDVPLTITFENFNNVSGGVVMAAQKTALAGTAFTVVPTYTTPDGVKVTNNGLNFTPNEDRTNGGKLYQWTRHFDGTEKMYFDLSKSTGWLGDVMQMAYFFKGGDNPAHAWVELTAVDNSIYSCTVPANDWDHVILVKLKNKNVQPDANGDYWGENGGNVDKQTGDIPLNIATNEDQNQLNNDAGFTSNVNIITWFAPSTDAENKNHAAWSNYAYKPS